MIRFLHVANGTSTTNLIEASGLSGGRSIWADPLYEGPVPGDVDDTELIRVRARHLAGRSETSFLDTVRVLQRWRDAIASVESYDELVLWYEHDLFDQLNLIQLLSWIKRQLSSATVVSLVSVGSFPGLPLFKGLGELTPAQIATLFDTRAPLSAEQYALAEYAWSAFRQPTPEAFDRLRPTDTGVLPFLAPAARRFLKEYPWTNDGLSLSERRLLRISSSGPIELLTAFARMHESETAYYITDLSFLAHLRELSGLTPPLLSVRTDSLATARIPSGTLTITDTGRAALDGRVDRVRAYGIDRWLGGTHLQANTTMWRWDEHHERMVRS